MPNPPNLREFTGKRWALFLDIDGTLLDLAPPPNDVFVSANLLSLLHRLQKRFGGAFALVSGRDLKAIDDLLSWRGRDAAGCHGAEFRMNGKVSATPASQEIINRVAERLIKKTAKIPHALVEIKSQGVALHYGATTIDDTMARTLALEAVGEFEHTLRMLPIKNGIELVPCAAGKGRAIARFMEYARYSNKVPIFAGDDVTDEAGFREVNARGGISIHIGDGPASAARYRVPTVEEMREWLKHQLDERVVDLSRRGMGR